jgi:hypothetical protein
MVQLDADAKDAVLTLCQTEMLAKLQNSTGGGTDVKMGDE